MRADFEHRGEILVMGCYSAFAAYCVMTRSNGVALRGAFVVIDFFCRLLGLKTIGGFVGPGPEKPPVVGEKLDFFTVEAISERALWLGNDDRHLSVKLNITTQVTDQQTTSVVVRTWVKTHNLMGRIYMLPVAPAHHFIVRSSLAKFKPVKV